MSTFRSPSPPPPPGWRPGRAARDAAAGALANDDKAREWPVSAALGDDPLGDAALGDGPEHWWLEVGLDGSFAYLTAPAYLGPHSFTYRCANSQ